MKYVAGCDEMILSLDNKIDQEAFDAAEAKQDEATDEISFAIQRMTALLLKMINIQVKQELFNLTVMFFTCKVFIGGIMNSQPTTFLFSFYSFCHQD